jgi:hypothetical protein
MRRLLAAALLLPALAGCLLPAQVHPGARALEQEAFWANVQGLCGKAFAGRLVEGNETDAEFARGPVVMHVRQCTQEQVRIALHVGEDRSRVWVLARVPGGLLLWHEHRLPNGADDPPTGYGGATRGPGSPEHQDFPADSATVRALPATRPNVWTLEIVPGRAFAYAMRREGTDRRFRLEFDLAHPVAAPPLPWGGR